jgi:hypothetical protein
VSDSVVLQENVMTNMAKQFQHDISFSKLTEIREEDSGMKEQNDAPFCMDKDVRSSLPLAEREKAVDDTIEWLRKQMVQLLFVIVILLQIQFSY